MRIVISKTADELGMRAAEASAKIIKEETAREELSVIITKRPCAMIVKQSNISRRVSDRCKNCKQCMKIGCPAIELENGRPIIVADRCVGCGLCLRVCPFDAIESEEQ